VCTLSVSTSIREAVEGESVCSISGGAGARFYLNVSCLACRKLCVGAIDTAFAISMGKHLLGLNGVIGQRMLTSSAVCDGPFFAAAAYDIFARMLIERKLC
jgi:hypothetical protein